jgi:hypothetical protein
MLPPGPPGDRRPFFFARRATWAVRRRRQAHAMQHGVADPADPQGPKTLLGAANTTMKPAEYKGRFWTVNGAAELRRGVTYRR